MIDHVSSTSQHLLNNAADPTTYTLGKPVRPLNARIHPLLLCLRNYNARRSGMLAKVEVRAKDGLCPVRPDDTFVQSFDPLSTRPRLISLSVSIRTG